MEIVTHDLDVRTLLFQHFPGRFGYRLTEAVVLVDQVHLLDVVVGGDVVGQRVHFHVGVGVEAEVPVGTTLVGERGVHGGVVQIQHLVTGVALVVLLNGGNQRGGHGRTVALGHVANAVIDRLLQLHQAFLRVHFVVQADDFQVLAVKAAIGVDALGFVLEVLERGLAGGGHGPGKRIDQGEFHCLGAGGTYQQQRGGEKGENGFQHDALHGCCFSAD